MTPLPTVSETVGVDCWNRIGVRGDRSCPELPKHGHCQNCPVFSAAGRRFLDAPSPPGYLDEWTDRLAATVDEETADLESVLIFRIADEWLALPVPMLVEVASPKPVRRIPHRAGILAGMVNIRGELYLCVHLSRVLGIDLRTTVPPPPSVSRRVSPVASAARMLVVRRDTERWVFPVDGVDQVHRVPRTALRRAPATVARAAADLSRGVFLQDDKAVGLLDDRRLFETLRTKLR